MSHEIDMSNGRANMAYTGALPWHGMGQSLERGATIEEWKVAAGLGWAATLAAVNFRDEQDNLVTMPDRFVLYRSDTKSPLCVVSDRYKPVQPGEVLEFYRDLVEQLGFYIETAGCLMGGRKVWALANAEDSFKLGKQDTIKHRLLLATSYDMTLPTTVKQVAERVVCHNTLTMALGEYGRTYHIKHMKHFDAEQAKKAMGIKLVWTEFKAAVEKLAGITMAEKKARAFLMDTLYPEAVQKRAEFSKDGAARRIDTLVDIMGRAPGSDLVSARGTLWGVVNAVTYYVDHVSKARTDESRLNNAWFGIGEQMKDTVFQAAVNLANA